MGKVIRVTPEELLEVSSKLAALSESYKTVSARLFQCADNMGVAWEGEDNVAFVTQISGLTDDLNNMAAKLNDASTILKKQGDNYIARKNANISQVKKLAN